MAAARTFMAYQGLRMSFMKGRLASIIFFFIVRLPKGSNLSSQAITVFFLSLSTYTLSMFFHMCELYLISYEVAGK